MDISRHDAFQFPSGAEAGATRSTMATIISFYDLWLKHLVTLKAKLKAHCIACLRRGILSVLELAFKRGPEANLGSLARVTKCAGCKKVGFVNVSAEW